MRLQAAPLDVAKNANEPLPYATPNSSAEQRRHNRRRILLWLAVTLTAGIALLFGCFVMLLRSVGRNEAWFDQQLASKAVTQILNGTLKPDANGIVKLPSALASTGLNGKVYVTTDAAGTTFILFEEVEGRGMNLVGELYHSNTGPTPLPATIKVLGPDPLGPTPSHMYDYNINKQNGTNWYDIAWMED
jgi:hypothetical protein